MTRSFALATFAAIVLASSPARATPEHLATIESRCAKQLQMSAAQCACLQGKAAALNDGQQAFIAAVVSMDKTTQRDLTQNMTVKELTEAGMFMFMTNAPAQCAKGE